MSPLAPAIAPAAAPTPGAPACALDDEAIVQAARGVALSGAAGATLLPALLDPDADGSTIARRIAEHPALAARVLKVANSAYYGLPRAVASIDRAIQMLGTAAVRSIAAAAAFDRLLGRGERLAPRLDALRHHSLAVGCAAHALARGTSAVVAGEAFVAGLLHDLGLAIQMKLRPEAFEGEPPPPMPAAEREAWERATIGACHACCAAVAFEAWGLPASLSAVVSRHHASPGSADAGLEVARLALADAAAAAAGFAQADDPAVDDAAVAAWCALAGIDPESWTAVVAALPAEVSAWRGGLE